jgi:hypothetical protein
MKDDEVEPITRNSVVKGPLPGSEGWLALADDDLLYRIQSLEPGHHDDDRLLEVVRSSRHFFLRQEAAKRVHDSERLKAFAGDRHIGQILARQMRRESDIHYLSQLIQEARHLEVRRAAQAQLDLLLARLGRKPAHK